MRGFTLPEILMALVIIGVISVVSIQSVKHIENRYDDHYYAALDLLTTAVGNAQKTYKPIVVDDYDFLIDPATSGSDKNFCEQLTSFINTTKNNCSVNPEELLDRDPDSTDNLFANGPSFIATNGMEFFISSVFDISYKLTPVDTSFMARFIGVDLNGSKGPNCHKLFDGKSTDDGRCKKGKKPDRVAFMIIRNGSVVPFGLPEVDRTYMSARVVYPDTLPIKDSTGQWLERVNLQDNNAYNGNDSMDLSITSNPQLTVSNAMSFFEARIIAWGDGTRPNKQGFSINEPYSYASLLYGYCDNAPSFISAFYDGITLPNVSAFNVDTDHGCAANNSRCYVMPLR